jgi:hypothetical protein
MLRTQQLQVARLICPTRCLGNDVVHREALALAVWVQPALAIALLAQSEVALDDGFP